MELKSLKEHIRSLAILPETDAPVISCYLSIENGRIKNRNGFNEQVRAITSALAVVDRLSRAAGPRYSECQ
jgi:hypothetical protein